MIAAATHAIAWKVTTTAAHSVQWGTPPAIYLPLHREFDFTLDAAAAPEMAVHVKYFTREDDALACDWTGHRVFCNPPFGRGLGKWMSKAHHEASENGVLVVMLVPARTDVAWFHDVVLKYAEIRWIRGRLGYQRNGQVTRKARAPFASMVCIFRPWCGAADRAALPQYTFPFEAKSV